jgi:ATP-dependent DNA ligase
VADFQRLRQRKHLLIVFDLLELDGKDLRREPIEVRKATLASVYSDFRLAPGKFHKKK